MRQSSGEVHLAHYLDRLGIKYEREYKFHPTRKWRFDFAFPKKMLAVEIEGAIWANGRHTRPQGFIKDMEKYNEASKMGWTILKFTTKDAKSGNAAVEIAKFLGVCMF